MNPARRIGLAGWIFSGMLAGIGCGLFFGEEVAWLSVLGDAFVDLLQMTVLPYITFSLVASIGGLPRGNSRRLAVSALIFLLVSWGLSLATVVLMPQVLPPLESASFFSTSLLTEPSRIDFVKLFIPANPFNALANNIVPAVVLFCICVGVAVMTLPRRREMVEAINLLTEALGRVNSFMVRLTPLGVFAITASTAGTMQLAEFERLQVYFLIYAIAITLLGGVILPGLLVSLTPFSYLQIMRALRVPVITAFATGKVFIVLPMLVDQIRELFDRFPDDGGERASVIRAVTPLIYPFPHAGRLMALLFIPFTAWFVDQPLHAMQYPSFLGVGLFSLFGSPVAAMPYLLDLLRLPADMFQLFLVSGVLTARMGDALGAVHILFVTVLTVAAVHRLLRWRLRSLLVYFAAATLLWAGMLSGCRTLLNETIRDTYTQDALVTGMQSRIPEGRARVVESGGFAAKDLAGLPVLERVERTGRLRLGYHPDNLPWSFTNDDGELVGLDIDLAYNLAEALSCDLEFVPTVAWHTGEELDRSLYDMRISGPVIIQGRLGKTRFTDPYMTITAALLVRDHDREAVSEVVRGRDYTGFRLGVLEQLEITSAFHHLMPGCEYVRYPTLRDYLESGGDGADAWLWSAEAGSAWTLLYPAFSVVPLEPLFQIPIAYEAGRDQGEFVELLNAWLEMTRSTGDLPRLYDYWILGRETEQRTFRWCIKKDVLGWGD